MYVLYFICIHYSLRLISNSNIDFQNLIFIFVPNISYAGPETRSHLQISDIEKNCYSKFHFNINTKRYRMKN